MKKYRRLAKGRSGSGEKVEKSRGGEREVNE